MPYKPRVADATDVSSFEATFTKEKPIDSIADKDDPDATHNANGAGQDGKRAKKGIISTLFGSSNHSSKKGYNTTGNGNNNAGENGNGKDDAFKDFSFAKEAPPAYENKSNTTPALVVLAASAPEAVETPIAAAVAMNNNNHHHRGASRSPVRERPAQASSLTAAINSVKDGNK